MGDIIFARPNWAAASYRDYWHLVELSGYPIIDMDAIDCASDNTYIFSTHDTYWYERYADSKARIIHYNLEYYLDVDFSVVKGVEVWTADKAFADLKGLKYVPMGSHVDLNPRPHETPAKMWDVVTLWAGSSRRYTARDMLGRSGVIFAPDGWEEERHKALSQSRTMCIVHQHDNAPFIAPQRIALAAAYKLPVITEHLADADTLVDVIVQTGLMDIGVVTASYMQLENYGLLTELAGMLYQRLCVDMPFRASVERAV